MRVGLMGAKLAAIAEGGGGGLSIRIFDYWARLSWLASTE